MRITLLTNYDAASSLALSYLLPELSQHDLTVFYTDKPAPRNPVPKALKELAEFERSLAGLDIPFLATKAELLNNINQPEGLQSFIESEPELVISIRHMSILKAPVIAIPKHGIINLHSGLLPAYRGVMATFWAMKNKEKYIGTTLHTIDDSSIDTGLVIAQTHTHVNYEKSYWWNTLNLYQAGCESIIKTVERISNSDALPYSQQNSISNYYTFPNQPEIDASNVDLYRQDETLSNWFA